MISLYDLEKYFADNFASPVFTILANQYYNKRQYNRAEKVCLIGLENDSKNYIGMYILAKIYLVNNKLKKAEKLLITVVNNDANNINALFTLIEVCKKLNRSQTTYSKYVEKAIQVLPNNKTIKSIHKKMQIPTKSNAKKTKQITKEADNIAINENMATKTMYQLMIAQNKNELAKQILFIMKKNKKNIKFVNSELKKLN